MVLPLDKIKIEENRCFWPDLIASKDGGTYYLEGENGQKENCATPCA